MGVASPICSSRASLTASQALSWSESARILRPRVLADHLGVSIATLWRMRQRGDLPDPIRISKNCVGWTASTIQQWLSAREAKR